MAFLQGEIRRCKAIQAELFARAIIEGTPVPTPIEDAVANMKVIEAIVASAASGSFEPV